MQQNPCGKHSACNIVGNLISCTCNDGYYSHTGDGKYCLPKAGCNCGSNSICTQPYPGGNVCTCAIGYHSPAANGRNCVGLHLRFAPAQSIIWLITAFAALSVCEAHPYTCGSHSTCTDGEPGEYTCQCEMGFVTDDVEGKNCHLPVVPPGADSSPHFAHNAQ